MSAPILFVSFAPTLPIPHSYLCNHCWEVDLSFSRTFYVKFYKRCLTVSMLGWKTKLLHSKRPSHNLALKERHLVLI